MFDEDLEKATFAGGKFWGVQYYFDQLPGVIESRVGYTGGKTENPTAQTVASQSTGHVEAIELHFDTNLISYETLLKHFFRIHDPTQDNGQAKNIGNQFKSVIFYHDDQQKEAAENTLKSVASKLKKPVTTKIIKASDFYPAEEKDQKYSMKTGQGVDHIPSEGM